VCLSLRPYNCYGGVGCRCIVPSVHAQSKVECDYLCSLCIFAPHNNRCLVTFGRLGSALQSCSTSASATKSEGECEVTLKPGKCNCLKHVLLAS
jgi:hypothetical protein